VYCSLERDEGGLERVGSRGSAGWGQRVSVNARPLSRGGRRIYARV
jgi:hypothetical protein